jgi:energy-coupling factor transport system ATP-binding protein
MIAIEGLRHRNLAVDALTIGPGITTIIGPNGSGKTTFLRICAGLELPHHGTVSIDGAAPREIGIGWVNEFPDRNILFERVSDEIASPLRFRRDIPCDVIDAGVIACAESLHIAHLLNRTVRELSGGEKVLVSLAAALVGRPEVLILDEYDSHLDAPLAAKAEQAIRASGARYVIRCTQQMNTAAESDYLLFFDAGRITHAGTPHDVFPLLRKTPFCPVLWECG